MGDDIVRGRYLLQCLSEVPEGDALPAGVERDSQGKYRVDGERIDPSAEYRVWNCANPRATFSEDAHMSDWSVGPA